MGPVWLCRLWRIPSSPYHGRTIESSPAKKYKRHYEVSNGQSILGHKRHFRHVTSELAQHYLTFLKPREDPGHSLEAANSARQPEWTRLINIHGPVLCKLMQYACLLCSRSTMSLNYAFHPTKLTRPPLIAANLCAASALEGCATRCTSSSYFRSLMV